MMFNHRRQSQDGVLREKILALAAQGKLWMNSYSAKQFADVDAQIIVDGDFADKAGAGDFCFFEDAVPDIRKVERLLLFKWNRVYPADLYFDIDLSEWMLEPSMLQRQSDEREEQAGVHVGALNNKMMHRIILLLSG